MQNNKVSEAQAIYINEIRRVQETAEKWKDFLDFAAQAQISENQSEFEFSSKLIIHAENPNAADCRTFGEWKTADGNHIKQGQHGIAVLSRNSKGNQSVTYLFDTSQTALAKEPERPEIPEEIKNNLKSALSDVIEIHSGNASFSDEQKRIFAATAEYRLCKQYSLETDENSERFSGIEKLSVKEIANIGVSLNRCSQSFSDIVNNERSNFYEAQRSNDGQSRDDRTELYRREQRGMDLGGGRSGNSNAYEEIRLQRGNEQVGQAERGTGSIRADVLGTSAEADSGNGQVRQHETEIHMADPSPDRSYNAERGTGRRGAEPEQALRGDERESSEPDRGNRGEEKAVGGIQGDRGIGEIPAESADTGEVQSGSGGRNTSGDGVRDITEKTAEPEKVSAVSDLSVQEETPEVNIQPEISIEAKQGEITSDILRGSGIQGGKQRIEAFYNEQQPNRKDFADFLKNEYGIGGHSGNEPLKSQFHDSKGLSYKFADGTDIRLSWSEAAKRISNLIDRNEYLNADEITPNDLNERKENRSDPFENSKRSKNGDVILGNTTFRYIPEKTYTKIDKDIAAEVSEQLEKQGIKFSGVIKGDTATITVSKPQKETLDKIIADISSPDLDVQLSQSEFIEIASNLLSADTTVSNAHKYSDKQNYRTEIDNGIDRIFTEALTGNRDIGYSVPEMSQLWNEFQNDSNVREYIRNIVSENVDISLTANEQLEIFSNAEKNDKAISFSSLDFEKKIPNEMRWKENSIVEDNTALYWVTQEIFTEADLDKFQAALKDTDIKKAYVIPRDLSGYSFEDDMANNTPFAVVTKDSISCKDYINTIKSVYNYDVSKQQEEENIVQSSEQRIYDRTEAAITRDMYQTENPDVLVIKGRGSLAKIDISVSDELWERLAEKGLVRNEDSVDRVIFNTDNGNWNKLVIPDKWGNLTNNISIEDVFTREELQTAKSVADFVIGNDDVQQVLDNFKEDITSVENNVNDVKESERICTPILETADENGRPTSYSTKYNDKFYWISENADGKYDIETDFGNGIVNVGEEYSDFPARYLAEEAFEDYIADVLSAEHEAEITEPQNEPFLEEISGNNGTVKYKVTENADEQYKYNVQIFTQGENGEFYYSGSGRFCETLDEAHAFIENDIAERTAEKDRQHSVKDEIPGNDKHNISQGQMSLFDDIPDTEEFSNEKNYQVVTYSNDSGADDKKDFPTLDEAVEKGRSYLYDREYEGYYSGIAILNTKEHKVEYYEGDFPLEGIFSEQVYQNSGEWQRVEATPNVFDTNAPGAMKTEQARLMNEKSANKLIKSGEVDIPLPQDLAAPIQFEQSPLNAERVTVTHSEASAAPAEEVVKTLDLENDKPEEKKSDNLFRITDGHLGEGSKKEKFKNNIEAIKTLQILEAEERAATPDEQETLSKYIGWGGLQEAFDDSISAWNAEYHELKNFISEEEYEAARSTVNDAFYTSPVITQAIYEGLANIGFNGGEVLEPSMGIGNFFGTMPDKMRENSNLSGIEIDSISGRIAQKLYPEANIAINGFENVKPPKATFDLAVGNVPFGNHGVNDKTKVYKGLLIHDYFFAKSLDSVRPGGVVSFVTSTGTLDKEDTKVRQMLAQKAELMGAVRLPNNAFQKNAGTQTATDIIFLKKREKPLNIGDMPMDKSCDWVHTKENSDGLKINSYFADNPEMVLGELSDKGRFGSIICTPIQGADLKEQLHEAMKNIKGEYSPLEFQAELDERAENSYLTATPDIENLTYTVVDDKLYFRVDDNLIPLKESEQHGVTAERRKAMSGLGETTRELLQAQVEDRPDKEIKLLQAELNVKYDKFVQKFGRINPIETPNPRNASGVTRKAPNSNVFKNDVRLPLLQSLEKMKEGQFVGKTAIFTERTIRPRKVAEHVDTAHEALILSMSEKGKIDFDYMQDLTGFEKEKIISDLHGDIYPVPELSTEDNTVYQTSDEYLSGNIYKKIAMAEAKISENPAYAENVAALTEVIPKPLKATEIDMQLGMTWIDTKIINQFMYETFETPQRFKEYDGDVPQKNPSAITVEYSGAGKGSWKVENARLDNSVKSTKNFGTKDYNAYELLEKILNAKSVAVTQVVRDDEGRQKTVILEKQTKTAEDKVKQINAAFKKWVFADPERRNELVKTYNEKFNGIRPREYDGSNLNFFGSNPEITLKPHQKNAVAHALFGGNTLFAHQVGAGKTFEMIATAMEGKRLGLHNKSMFVVPNHLTEQIGSDFMKLYPNANILVAKPDDFSPQKRRQMCARIATGNFDAVIIGHSQLIKIPLSAKREEAFIKNQIDDIVSALEAAKETDNKSYTVKQLEATRKNLRERLEKLTNGTVKDNAVTFEELGVDKLFVDEAHEFKNLYVSTKMENVSGLSTNADVQKTQDLYMKCQYLDEKTDSKGIVFSTGTPVTNALSEMYTTMKYLQSDLLRETGLDSFDAWAGNFTRKSTEAEISPSGSDWRMKTRLKFTNVPELVTMFKECADVKMADQLNLDVPECEKHIVSVEPTEAQKAVVHSLAIRAEAISKGEVSRTEDNMLVVTGDGRKLGLDQRLYDLKLPDEPQTKLNACIQNVFDIWEKTSDKKSTQLVFCDLGVPQSKEDLKKNGERFDVYADIRSKLIEKGVPEKEIAFIHEANSETEKAKLFAKVRSGDVRVLIGSTQKMGAGTNVQDKLVALHDLDCPWRPADLTQRLGRMVRQGNENKKVDNFRYVTKGTFDAYLYQMVEKKQESISQIFTSKAIARTCDDIDDMAVDLMQVKMAAVGDDRIRRQMELKEDIRSLNMLKNTYLENKYEIEDNIKRLPEKISRTEKIIEGIAADTKTVNGYVPKKDIDGQEIFEMQVGNTLYVEKKEAAEALKTAMTTAVVGNPKAQTDIAEYKGFKIAVSYDSFTKSYTGHLKGENSYQFEFGSSESGNMTRIDNAIAAVPLRIDGACNELDRLKTELADSIKEVDKPFEHEAELEEKKQELERLTDEINADKVKGEIAPEQPESTEKSSEKAENQAEKAGNLNIKWRQNDKELRITYDSTAENKITAYSDGKEIGHCTPDELTVTKISESEQKNYPDGINKCVKPLNLAFSNKISMHIREFAVRVRAAEKSAEKDDKALFSRDRIMSDEFKPTSEKTSDTPKQQEH
ncbi:MAG: SNF2-related protein [Ruminococcus flavefaciens]|nr:SNF2-related protein [Ruminococcus flavefaciens]MCM1059272.1 SNF2-related protein [Eubacterium sp.]